MKRTKKTPHQKAWEVLKICREGKDPHLTANSPSIQRAAKVVGVTRAIRFLTSPTGSKDLMARGKRLPGSFESRK